MLINAGRVTLRLCSHYSVSKYGIEAFSDALRREMYPWGLKVSILEPGAFQTNMNSRLSKDLEDSWKNLNVQLKAEYGEEYMDTGIL